MNKYFLSCILAGLTLSAVFLTHGHYDHRDAVPDILQVYPDLPVYIHYKERLQTGLPSRYYYGGPCVTYGEGDTVSVGTLSFQVLETPGHTAGSVVLDLPGGSVRDMLQSLRRLAEIPGDRQVYPGHGPATTLAEERRFNPYMRRAAER